MRGLLQLYQFSRVSTALSDLNCVDACAQFQSKLKWQDYVCPVAYSIVVQKQVWQKQTTFVKTWWYGPDRSQPKKAAVSSLSGYMLKNWHTPSDQHHRALLSDIGIETQLSGFTTITGWATQLKVHDQAITASYQMRPQTCHNLDDLFPCQRPTCCHVYMPQYMHIYFELTCLLTCIDLSSVCLLTAQGITLSYLAVEVYFY